MLIDSANDAVASRKLDELVAALSIDIAPVTFAQAQVARAAYVEFGKGRGHPAALNDGDCFSYALAKTLDTPLLYKEPTLRSAFDPA